MEKTDGKQPVCASSEVSEPPTARPFSENGIYRLASQQGEGKTCDCEDTASRNANYARDSNISYIYTVGQVGPRFPDLSVEKEFAQAVGRVETGGQPDRKTFYTVLSQPENRYLVRLLCWVNNVQGQDTYILKPRDPTDFNLLVDAIDPELKPPLYNVIVGRRGPIATPEMCNGLMIPIVVFDQIYSFDRGRLIDSVPVPDNYDPEKFRQAIEEVFDRIVQMLDNAGASYEHRAMNYLAMRYPAIYSKAAEQFEQGFSLSAIDARRSRLSGIREIVSVIFSYTHRQTGVDNKFFVRVDITGGWPFLSTKLSPYYDR